MLQSRLHMCTSNQIDFSKRTPATIGSNDLRSMITIINAIRDLHWGPQYGTITTWIEERFIAVTFFR